jgi:hypothetical protein
VRVAPITKTTGVGLDIRAAAMVVVETSLFKKLAAASTRPAAIRMASMTVKAVSQDSQGPPRRISPRLQSGRTCCQTRSSGTYIDFNGDFCPLSCTFLLIQNSVAALAPTVAIMNRHHIQFESKRIKFDWNSSHSRIIQTIRIRKELYMKYISRSIS